MKCSRIVHRAAAFAVTLGATSRSIADDTVAIGWIHAIKKERGKSPKLTCPLWAKHYGDMTDREYQWGTETQIRKLP
jgi:hypothetical protein